MAKIFPLVPTQTFARSRDASRSLSFSLSLSLSLSLSDNRVGVCGGNQSANDSLIVTRGTRSLMDATAGVRRQSHDRTARARGSLELISARRTTRRRRRDAAAGLSLASFSVIGHGRGSISFECKSSVQSCQILLRRNEILFINQKMLHCDITECFKKRPTSRIKL